jgi:hypothetical protein
VREGGDLPHGLDHGGISGVIALANRGVDAAGMTGCLRVICDQQRREQYRVEALGDPGVRGGFER